MMGDSTDGSSTAAHSAQPIGQTEPEEHGEQGGFLRRIFGALSQGDDTATPDENHNEALASDGPGQGLGLGNLRLMTVDDVSVPRADIVAVPVDITKDELVQVFRESGLTRLPVYDNTLDTPVGMAHLKDLALKHGFNGETPDFALDSMLRPLLFVPPSMTIGVLLQKMQSERRHMALVIDEYGGVDGLVTIEDLVEQVVGEIADEHDADEDVLWTQESPGCWLVLAKTPLSDFEAEIGQSLTDDESVDEEEIDTLGGLVFMLLGRVPVRGEVLEHPNGAEIEVIDADPRRVQRLRLRLPGHGEG